MILKHGFPTITDFITPSSGVLVLGSGHAGVVVMLYQYRVIFPNISEKSLNVLLVKETFKANVSLVLVYAFIRLM